LLAALGGLAALLGLLAAGTALPACTRLEPSGEAPPSEEQRLLPGIVRQQERKLRAATQAAEAARDQAAALRLRQRILTAHGRHDLAARLEPEAAAREAEAQEAWRRVADEQAALDAYRDYAGQAGIRLDERGPPAGADGAATGDGRGP
jgi:hypothetical protein